MGAVRALWDRLYNLWSHHPSLDWLLATLSTSALGLWAGRHILAQHSSDHRMDIYATVSSVAAIVGGFGTAAISQYATSSGSRMAFLRQTYGAHLRRNWVGLLTSMLSVAGGCLGVMFSDTGDNVGWPGWLVEGLIFLGVYRSLRLVWLFRLLIDVSDYDAENRTPGSRVEVVEIPPERQP